MNDPVLQYICLSTLAGEILRDKVLSFGFHLGECRFNSLLDCFRGVGIDI
jgi:hypothetical protein